ncbi:STAS domain-containing protein [Spirochaeta africana]|uniref:STAS domain-containing protein n=1 Tax=Spirochaeta africana (strain ATCC 700263 / DSM 8902 / Z-7692) TaxID=889378 RepID=H9ULL4_SPIAZ|nr:STAS domain-containing protein [Spirochaeta africana]AFG38407.1 hypothetical protein Spiaf_2375 [Spirochaeta africana DSM 8902]
MIEVKSTKKKSTVIIRGRLTHSEAAEVHARLLQAVQAAGLVELDLDGVTGIDLAGYQLLLSLSRSAAAGKTTLQVNAGSCAARLQKLGGFAGLPQPFGGEAAS